MMPQRDIRIPRHNLPISVYEQNGVVSVSVCGTRYLCSADDLTRFIETLREAQAAARESEKKA